MASLTEIEKYKHEARVARRNGREIAEEGAHKFMTFAETNAVAFGFGVWQGRGGWDVGGMVPVELVTAGLAGLGSLYLGDKSKISPHLFNVAIGASNAYSTQTGFSIGKDSLTKK